MLGGSLIPSGPPGSGTASAASPPGSGAGADAAALRDRMDDDLRAIAAARGGLPQLASMSSSASSPPATPLKRGGSGGMLVQAIPLSEDHNARMPREQAQMRMLHPEEEDVVVSDRR
jgi:hypothetical protein